MRKTLATLTLCVLAIFNYAQDKLPAFGKIEKADLEMKTCEFDPDGEALYLIDLGEVQYNINVGAIYIQTDHRYRVKILKEKGIEEGNVKFWYHSKDRYEEISNIVGYSYNLDDNGNIISSKLEKSQIFDKKVNENYSEISFAMPNVKPGTVIEYKYRSYKKSFGNISPWYFQRDVPVKYSAYNLLIPEYFDFTYQITRRQDLDVKKSLDGSVGTWYVMRNIPALREEPFIAGKKDYYQRIDFQLAAINFPGQAPISVRSTWPKLTEELLEDEDFGVQINKNIPKTAELDGQLKMAKTSIEKMQIIYTYVQKNMDWNGSEGIWSAHGIKSAWDKKSGSSADINLILINLLKDAKVKVYPLLASTKDNGRVNTTYPLLNQFNEVLAFVKTDNNERYILDASDKYNSFKLIPYDIQRTECFVVDKKDGGWIQVNDHNQKMKHNIALHIDVDESGKIVGEAMVNSWDYGRNSRLSKYKKGQIKSIFETTDGIDIHVDSITVKNVDDDSLPLEQKLAFSGNLQTSGEYSFLSYNLFTGMGKNALVADKRQTDIDLNYPQYYGIQGAYILPDNFEFEDLPKNMRMIMPDTSIMLTRILQKDNNVLNFKIIIDFKRAVYAAEEYPDVKEFYKKLYAALNERIVIKKKK